MTENCHNSGRLPWSLLMDSIHYIKKPTGHGIREKFVMTIDEMNIYHFARVMTKTLKEFAETFKDDVSPELNPLTWHYSYWMSSCGAQVAYPESLLRIYVLLNLVLMNTEINKSTMVTDNWVYNVCAGEADLGESPELEKEFRSIRDRLILFSHKESYTLGNDPTLSWNTYHKLAPLTSELVVDIRSYLKKVFICLIRIYQCERRGKTLEEDHIARNIMHIIPYVDCVHTLSDCESECEHEYESSDDTCD